jgi:hypothetical protein
VRQSTSTSPGDIFLIPGVAFKTLGILGGIQQFGRRCRTADAIYGIEALILWGGPRYLQACWQNVSYPDVLQIDASNVRYREWRDLLSRYYYSLETFLHLGNNELIVCSCSLVL